MPNCAILDHRRLALLFIGSGDGLPFQCMSLATLVTVLFFFLQQLRNLPFGFVALSLNKCRATAAAACSGFQKFASLEHA